MAHFKNKKKKELPAISTASLPDIVFMLLFFFMVATVMRDTTLKVENELPYADQVEKLQKKSLIMYIYAGTPSNRYRQTAGSEPRIQLNDKFARVSDVQPYILEEKSKKRPELRRKLITSLKMDDETNMGLVSDVKHELRKVEAYKINYTTKSGEASKNF
jgi:biopolymer transport protein ExbD